MELSLSNEDAVNESMKATDSIKVLVRVRPLSDKEISENNESIVDIQNNQSLKVTSADGKKSFQCTFDTVLGQGTTQTDVYETVRSCTKSVLDGFNSTIFAYGQTGSGKVGLNFLSFHLLSHHNHQLYTQTYSMYGPPNSSTSAGQAGLRDSEFMGLIPRAVNEIFAHLGSSAGATSRSGGKTIESKVYCSFVQIYNENLFDMLR
jgi:hypothetical protein